MRYTRETFIEVAKVKHGDKYDYSHVDYVNQSTPVEIVCPEHGSFYRTPAYHLQGGGCPVCAKIRCAEILHRPKSEEQKKKRRETMLQKYGATTFAGSQKAKELHASGGGPWSEVARKKAATTCEQRFGAKTWAESDVGRQTLVEMCSDEEVRTQMSVRAKSVEARQHYAETSRQHCGAEHWTKTSEGKAKLHAMFSTDEERLARSRRMLSPEVRAKIEATGMARYGVPYYWQSDEGRVRLKELLNAESVREKMRQTNLVRYGNESWSASDVGRQCLSQIFKSEEMQHKITEGKRRNGTINDSKPEKMAYSLLVEKFGEDDVVAQYRCERYPFKCDFYVKSRDMFIELNAHWMHGQHWFDENNADDLERLQLWLSRDKPAYGRAVYIWTNRDLMKRDVAERNHLNYIVFWDNDLSDMKAWLATIS